MTIKTCAEYAPIICQNCCCKAFCSKRLRKRNKKLVICACRFAQTLFECSCFMNTKSACQAVIWGNTLEEFFLSKNIQTREDFEKEINKNTCKEYFNFAENLKACYAIFYDNVLLHVDRAFIQTQRS